jgi:OOP family OmpA-OmpF porin
MDKRLGLTAFATLALTAAMAAHADVQPGFYAGASIGTTKLSDDSFEDSGIDLDDSDTGFKIFGGYAFNKNLAVELGYFDLGEASGSFSDPFIGDASFDVGVSGLNASVVGRVPVSETFSLFGKLGFASYDLDGHVTIFGLGSASDSQSETDLTYGIGAALSLGPQWEMRAEYEAIDVDNGDANMLSVGAMYRF